MYRISGDGCYIMILHTSSHQQLEETLADVLHYGDYRINTVIKTIEKRKNKRFILSFLYGTVILYLLLFIKQFADMIFA